jgi:hypothetical protein
METDRMGFVMVGDKLPTPCSGNGPLHQYVGIARRVSVLGFMFIGNRTATIASVSHSYQKMIRTRLIVTV